MRTRMTTRQASKKAQRLNTEEPAAIWPKKMTITARASHQGSVKGSLYPWRSLYPLSIFWWTLTVQIDILNTRITQKPRPHQHSSGYHPRTSTGREWSKTWRWRTGSRSRLPGSSGQRIQQRSRGKMVALPVPWQQQWRSRQWHGTRTSRTAWQTWTCCWSPSTWHRKAPQHSKRHPPWTAPWPQFVPQSC